MNRKRFSIGFACLIALFLIPHFVHAQDSRPMVRVVYRPLPGSPPRLDADTEIDALIKETQRFFADEMERHGFGRKTFQFETDASGNTVVHHGKLDSPGKNIVVYMEGGNQTQGVCGVAGASGSEGHKGHATIYCWNWKTVAHELGHAFGLKHDFRIGSDNYIMSYGPKIRPQLSHCTAEWLDTHRAFNPGRSAENEPTKIEMLSSSLDSPPNTIRFRFKVTDPDGLHQVQLLTPTVTPGIAYGSSELLSYKALNGTTNTTVEFVTNLTPNNKSVSLMAIDVHGNFTWNFQKFPINVTSLLPQAEVVSIPDANLAAAVRQTFRLSSSQAITTHSILNLRILDVPNSGITDLTGLEHAHNLRSLNLGAESIEGEGTVNSNTVSELSPLSELTNLTRLNLGSNNISDVSALSELTNLTSLNLYDNNISDISVLSELKNMSSLYLANNNISDISALSELKNMSYLRLGNNNIFDISVISELKNMSYLRLDNNNISDISVLSELKNMSSLYLANNNISDISALSGLTNLTQLWLHNNNISDVSPLVKLNLIGTQWDSTGLYLWNNPLNNEAIRTHIPAMQARGIVVSFDNITHPEFLIISGDKQEELVGKTLPSPFVVEYRDANGKPKEGVKVTFSIADGDAELTDTTVTTDAAGRAQTFLRFGWKLGTITVNVTAAGINSQLTFTASVVLPENHVPEDVNADGIVDVEDLVLVAATIGTTQPDGIIPNTDVNGDGVVNSDDLALVMAALETTPTAPAAVLTAENLQRWIDEAKQLTNKDETFQRGITVLEQLLTTLLPKKTALLTNYPNPFNPETWVPYHLAKPAEVTVRIYAVNGTLIRSLALGHKSAGIYELRNRAAYWDGKNAQGERVASGIYFYTLTAGDFTATRKMLIRK